MTEREVLRRAKEIILNQGWHEGGTTPVPGGPRCLMGALGDGAGIALRTVGSLGTIYSYPDIERLPAFKTVQRCAGLDPDDELWKWNDDHSVDEVIALIDKALSSLPADVETREPVLV